MGEVEMRREQRGDQSLVFAILPTGHAVWGMDLVTRQEWWYAPEYETALGAAIHARAAALARPDAAHAAVDRYVAAADAAFPVEVRTQIDDVDLAAHRPGHAVLAQIAAKHAAATSSVLSGEIAVLDDDIAEWCWGFVGEEIVGGLLEGLGPGWRVLHSVPVGNKGSDIDHVVIGPGGVFAVNTKHHAGKTVDVKGDAVFVSGQHQFYIRNARLEADRATAVLSRVVPGMTAYPVVAVVGGTVRVKEAPAGVYVMNSAALTSWLLGLPPVLTAEQVAQVYDAMRWSQAWTSVPPPSAAPDWVAEFARHLAAERAAVAATRTPRRRASASGAPASPTRDQRGSNRSTRPPKSGGRGRSRSKRSAGEEIARLIAALAMMGLIIWLAPSWIQGITDRAKDRQQQVITKPEVVTPLTRCEVRGAEAVTASGKPLTCARVEDSTVLRWQALSRRPTPQDADGL